WEVQLCCGSVGLVCVSTLAELVAVGPTVTSGVGGSHAVAAISAGAASSTRGQLRLRARLG
ncbi:hypothetical protein, partial [Mycobacterium marinum]|uniref:hypothetical protein n=1 Tax=Mycobacterium marinum TaxID=1781 RepID=UPI0021C2F456